MRHAAAESVERRARYSEIFGSDDVAANMAAIPLGNQSLTRQRNFIKAACAVHHKSALHTKFYERRRNQIDRIRRKHAENLCLGSRRVGQRPKQVEDSPLRNLLSSRPGMACWGVSGLRTGRA